MGHIYTRTGDRGSTGLLGGVRVEKSNPRIEILGTLDELNAALGLGYERLSDADIRKSINQTQSDLLLLGSYLGNPKQSAAPKRLAQQIPELARLIDAWWDNAGLLQNFILPGGPSGAAELHLARAICRRLERCLTMLEGIDPTMLAYVNRLSDFLFASARAASHRSGGQERVWRNRA